MHLTPIRALLVGAAMSPAIAMAGEHEGDVAKLFAAMQMTEILAVMQDEGREYAGSIAGDFFPGRNAADWGAIVERIYDIDRMEGYVLATLTAELEGDDVASMVEFFESEPGETIISLELAARRAMLDPEVEEAAKEVAALARAEETDRFAQIETFVNTNDLVETNVVGAMNSNYAFYSGLVDGGAMPAELTEEEILQDVWSQEPEIRQNTTEWVYSFLMLAYEPLEDADLDAYIAFSDTDTGQALNAALFRAFDGMFEGISRSLGLATAQFAGQQDL